MKVKKFLKVLEPTTEVVIIESNNYSVLKSRAYAIYSEYPKDYFTYCLLNRHISMIQTDKYGKVMIILKREDKKNER